MANLTSLNINDTDFLKIPSGSTAQRPTASAGLFRHNSTTNRLEFNDGSQWIDTDDTPTLEQGLVYRYYTFTSSESYGTSADVFDTMLTGQGTVVFGGTGDYNSAVDWGNAGSTVTKPSYLPADYFSWVAEGFLYVSTTATYTFNVNSDDGADIWVNGQVVADYYGAHGASNAGNQRTIDLVAGNYYTFMCRMEEHAGGDGISVQWSRPGVSMAVIPSTQYYRIA